MSRQSLVLLVVLVVFMAGLWQGFRIAMNKPLWNDEIFSQMQSVDNISWKDIWLGHIQEGNNSPLFYSVQKIICSLSGYRTINLWKEDNVRIRCFLRIAPVVCMSLGLALIVGFFCAYYSFWGGLIAFIIAIPIHTTILIHTEARPYAFVFLVTAAQALFLLYVCRFAKEPRYGALGLMNFLMALITWLSVIQIVAAGVILWLSGYRRVFPFLSCIGLPLFVAAVYYMNAIHLKFRFMPLGMPTAVIGANIPAVRLAAFFIFPLLIWGWDRFISKEKNLFLWPFFFWSWLTFIGYVLFLGYLFAIQRPHQGFEVSNRYLMSLTPIGIVCLTVAILEFLKRPRRLWIKIVVWIGIALVILPRLSNVYSWIVYGL